MGTKILIFFLKSVRYPVLLGDYECIDIDGRTPISGTVSRAGCHSLKILKNFEWPLSFPIAAPQWARNGFEFFVE